VKVDIWRGAPTIQAIVLDAQRVFIVDTGSNISLIKPGMSRSEIRATNLAQFGVRGNELEVTGVQEVEFRGNNRNYRHQFYVCSLPTDADGIIGMDFLGIVNAKLDLEKQELRLLKCAHIDHGSLNQALREAGGKANRLALTAFAASNGHESVRERKQEVRKGGDRPREEGRQHPHSVSLQEAASWVVKTTETIKTAPRVKQIVVARVELPKRRASPDLVCVEPAQLPFEGLLPARGLARVVAKPQE